LKRSGSRDYGADLEIAIAHAWMTRLRAARGEFVKASAFEREYAGNAAGAAWMVDQIASASLLHVRGRHEEALRLPDELQEAAQTAGRTGGMIEILVLRALALWATNKKERVVNILAGALALAEPEGYVRTFVDEEAPMGGLLSATLEARQRGHLDAAGRISVSYLARLLAAVAQEATAPASDGRLAEPLSERELEVLALIAAGKSNKEIAARLFVSTSTVKTHINNLYRKLGARSRTQAIGRAREMDLL
jgi:LuxR family maltose regulon positive regulatory protein